MDDHRRAGLDASDRIERLIEIMATLRDPVGGCPWDLKQDFRSIAAYTLEEAFEVVDAIERDSMTDLRDELGDLLLQVVFHAQLADERRAFAFGDVVRSITAKMIRRHPHVFGAASAGDPGSAKASWNEIKAEEKQARRTEDEAAGRAARPWLDEVPASFPALTLALKLQSRAAEVGFDWDEPRLVAAKVEEELQEFRAARDSGVADDMEGEFGDLLFSLVNLARHLGIDPESALRRTNGKFRSRFGHVENALNAAGSNLRDASLVEMEALWQDAKAAGRDVPSVG